MFSHRRGKSKAYYTDLRPEAYTLLLKTHTNSNYGFTIDFLCSYKSVPRGQPKTRTRFSYTK